MKKVTQDNDVTNCIGAVYTENIIESSWSIRQGMVYDENDTGQWHDQ